MTKVTVVKSEEVKKGQKIRDSIVKMKKNL